MKTQPTIFSLLCLATLSVHPWARAQAQGLWPSPNARVCLPGQQVTCACPGGASTSVQVCNADGSGLLPCQCGSAVPVASPTVVGSLAAPAVVLTTMSPVAAPPTAAPAPTPAPDPGGWRLLAGLGWGVADNNSTASLEGMNITALAHYRFPGTPVFVGAVAQVHPGEVRTLALTRYLPAYHGHFTWGTDVFREMAVLVGSDVGVEWVRGAFTERLFVNAGMTLEANICINCASEFRADGLRPHLGFGGLTEVQAGPLTLAVEARGRRHFAFLGEAPDSNDRPTWNFSATVLLGFRLR